MGAYSREFVPAVFDFAGTKAQPTWDPFRLVQISSADLNGFDMFSETRCLFRRPSGGQRCLGRMSNALFVPNNGQSQAVGVIAVSTKMDIMNVKHVTQCYTLKWSSGVLI